MKNKTPNYKFDKNSFSHYEYEVGRYVPAFLDSEEDFVPYSEDTTKLIWNVIDYDINTKRIRVMNIFECNWVFLKDGLLYAKKHYSDDFVKFASHVRQWLQNEYWSKCEYEVIVSGWPGVGFSEEDVEKLNKEIETQKEAGYKHPSVHGYDDTSYKIDVYTQVMMNWDKFINYIWNNKNLITKKKLGLD